ncbi:MAG: prolipoprotein diacylglyceryl transferase [Dehalococcoidia bacterium]|nr:prolipoprotein diacylglyceryl transferase [Dehalococcoidia bacterium]
MTLLTINIGINPEIISIFGLLISWHGVFTAVGIGTGLWLALRLAAARGADPDDAYTLGLVVVIGGIIGARLLYVAENWSRFEDNFGGVFAINEGGISIYGAVIGGIVTGFAFAAYQKSRVPLLTIGDAGAAGGILGMAIGRIGDIINGEHLAESSGLPWAVRYTHANSPAIGLPPQHPAVAYEMLGDLAILGLLLLLWTRVGRPGVGFFTWVLAYGVLRFFLSFLREDKLVLDGLRMAQVIAIGAIVAGVIGLVWVLTHWAPVGSSRAERRRAAAGR